MTRRLLLIRHAKSSWGNPGLPDAERPLNDRGRRDAPRLAAWLAAEGLRPGHVLLSPARRTRETWDLLAAPLGEPPVTLVPGIYEAEPAALLAAIRAAPPVPLLALIGHNPGIGETAYRLLASSPRDEIFAKYPTAATALLAFDGEGWGATAWGTARLDAFVTPKTLPET